MDREKIILNMLFLVFSIPVIYLIYYSYSTYFSENKMVNPKNIYDLYISNFTVSGNYFSFNVNNPNNYSVEIYFSYLALKNSYQTSSIIASGSFLQNIYVIQPNSYIILQYNFELDDQTRLTIIQWEKLGGILYLTLYYSSVGNNSISGIINYQIEKI
jgi:ABC-type glycerol-3-phosphate transport system permease component